MHDISIISPSLKDLTDLRFSECNMDSRFIIRVAAEQLQTLFMAMNFNFFHGLYGMFQIDHVESLQHVSLNLGDNW